MEKNKVLVVIVTYNEENNVKTCLESVKWADEIVVVDMYSTDKTVEIAKSYKCKIFMHKKLDYADPARQFAIEHTSNNWILSIDADEVITKRLEIEIKKIVTENKYDAVNIPMINYFHSYKVKAAGWGPLQDKHIRLFKKECVYFTDEIHNFFHLTKTTKLLQINDSNCSFLHFPYSSLEKYIDKLNNYTKIEAENIFNELKPKYSKYKPLKEFLKRFFLQKGYEDGFMGLKMSLIAGLYYFIINIKLEFLKKYNTLNISEKVSVEKSKIINKYHL